MLDYDLHRPPQAGEGEPVAVLLHGRGSHKGDLQGLTPLLPDSWSVVTPQAPYPGASWGYGRGWAWYRYIEENRLDPRTLDESLGKLEGFLTGLPDLLGYTPGSIVLGGFSQGGTTSVAYALGHPGHIRAVWNFSGFVHADLDLPTGDEAASATPIFWGHGTRDPAIPFEIAEIGRAALREAGVPLAAFDLEIGHWIAREEVEAALEALPAA